MGVPVLKDIPNYEGVYQASTDGRIFSNISNKFLKFNILKNGYATVELFKNKKSKRLLVHRLIAQTFISNPLGLPQVNHKDENKLNNNTSNLEWCTNIYNMNYGTRLERQINSTDYSKENRKIIARMNGKKVSKAVIQMYRGLEINKFTSIKDASQKLKINASHIGEVCKNKRKTADGYSWKYERNDDLSESQY